MEPIISLMGLSWVMNKNIHAELLAWEDFSSKRKMLRLIPLTIIWVHWKERNNRAFEGIELDFNKFINCWFHYFGSTILGHNIDCLNDFGFVVDSLIDL